MRRALLGFALLSAGTLLGATALAGSAVAAPPPSGEPGWVACAPSGEKLTYKPKRHLLSCADGNSGLRRLAWSSWTGTTAKATGVYYWNTCDPACATGEELRSPATVTLKRVRSQHGADVYTRFVIRYADANGKASVLREDSLSWMG